MALSSNFTPDQSNKLLNIQKRCNRKRSPTTYTPRHIHMRTHTCTDSYRWRIKHTDAQIILKENATKRYKIPTKQQCSVPQTHAKTHQKTEKKQGWWRGEQHHSQFEQTYQPHTHLWLTLCFNPSTAHHPKMLPEVPVGREIKAEEG